MNTGIFAVTKGSECKTIPVICSWCRKIFNIRKWQVACGERITPDYGICSNCLKRVRMENRNPHGINPVEKISRIFMEVSMRLDYLIVNWFINHIKVQDKKLAKFLHEEAKINTGLVGRLGTLMEKFFGR